MTSPEDYIARAWKYARWCEGGAEQAMEWLASEIRRRELLLQSLTPGGSEYVTDPELCAQRARETRAGLFRMLQRAVSQVRDMEARASADGSPQPSCSPQEDAGSEPSSEQSEHP